MYHLSKYGYANNSTIILDVDLKKNCLRHPESMIEFHIFTITTLMTKYILPIRNDVIGVNKKSFEEELMMDILNFTV